MGSESPQSSNDSRALSADDWSPEGLSNPNPNFATGSVLLGTMGPGGYLGRVPGPARISGSLGLVGALLPIGVPCALGLSQFNHVGYPACPWAIGLESDISVSHPDCPGRAQGYPGGGIPGYPGMVWWGPNLGYPGAPGTDILVCS